MKVRHNQRFYIINNESYIHYYADHIRKQTGDDYTFINYEWVIPMYVYSINNIWNGEERFHLSPVNFAEEKNKKTDNWKWMREFKYEMIGKEIFNTEKQAWKVYKRKYSDELHKKYSEIHQLKVLKGIK